MCLYCFLQPLDRGEPVLWWIQWWSKTRIKAPASSVIFLWFSLVEAVLNIILRVHQLHHCGSNASSGKRLLTSRYIMSLPDTIVLRTDIEFRVTVQHRYKVFNAFSSPEDNQCAGLVVYSVKAKSFRIEFCVPLGAKKASGPNSLGRQHLAAN